MKSVVQIPWNVPLLLFNKENTVKKVNKSDFVRNMPKAPASAVIAAGKKAGIKLDDKYVYHVRYMDRARAKKNGKMAGVKKIVASSTYGKVGAGGGHADIRSLVDAFVRDVVTLAKKEVLRDILSKVERA